MYAVGIMLVALAVSMLPGLVESSVLISSTASGPLLGVFLLALLCPSANKYVRAFFLILTRRAIIEIIGI